MNIEACVWQIKIPNKVVVDCPKIHSVEQTDFTLLFAVRLHGRCLNNQGKWEIEPLPSSRDESFIKRCRFNTFKEAVLVIEREFNL
jgi:hypothetical protein